MCTVSWHAYAHATCSNKYCAEFVAVLPCYAIALYLDCGRNHGIAVIERPPAKLSKRLIYSRFWWTTFCGRATTQQAEKPSRAKSNPIGRGCGWRSPVQFSSAGEPTSSPADRRRQRQRFSEAAAVTLSGWPRGTSRPRRCVRAALSKQRRWERFILCAVTFSHPARFVSPDWGRLAGGVELVPLVPPPVAPFRVQSRT